MRSHTVTQMAKEPADVAELIAWMQGDKGPQDEFLFYMDQRLRAASLQKGDALKLVGSDKTLKAYQAAPLWLLVTKSQIDTTDLAISTTAFTANKMSWFQTDGNTIGDRIVAHLQAERGGREYSTKEQQGLVLTSAECTQILRGPDWDSMVKLTKVSDIVGLVRLIGADSETGRLVMRGLLNAKQNQGVALKDSEIEKAAVTNMLARMEKAQGTAIEGALSETLLIRERFPADFGRQLGGILGEVMDIELALPKAMALLLDCKESELPSKPSALVKDGLELLIGIYTRLIGIKIGSKATTAISNVFMRWERYDSRYDMWGQFYSVPTGAKEASAWALLVEIIMPRLAIWFGDYWKFLKNGDTSPVSLEEFFQPVTMQRDCTRYVLFVQNAEQAKQTAARGRNGGQGTAVKAPRADKDAHCKVCSSQGRSAAQCNHREQDCFRKGGGKGRGNRDTSRGRDRFDRGRGRRSRSRSRSRERTARDGETRQCHKCGKTGHIMVNCPEGAKRKADGRNDRRGDGGRARR